MESSGTFSRNDIKRMLIDVHRENQLLWGKWYRQAATADEKSSLYRYREGFDAAIFFLVERLAEEIADVCLRNTYVRRVDVTVDKPGALRFARSVAVEIIRFQEGKNA